MTHIDDISVGDWVAVLEWTRYRSEDDDDDDTRPVPDGMPLRVVAISLPFLAVMNYDEVVSLDARACRLQKLQKKYANTVINGVRARKRKPKQSMICTNCKSQLEFNPLPDGSWKVNCTVCEAIWIAVLRRVTR